MERTYSREYGTGLAPDGRIGTHSGLWRWQEYVPLILLLFIFEAAMAIWGIRRPAWTDEGHFVETIRSFGNGVNLDLLKHYHEMSTPLPFAVYALWGKAFGFSLTTLRTCSLLIAFVTFLFSFRLFTSVLRTKVAAYATAFLALNPYVAGSGLFVYTDMLALLSLVVACIAILERRPVMLLLSLAAGLLCRQYLVFFWGAATAFFLLRILSRKREQRDSWMLAACILAATPLLALVVLWRGLAPDSSLRPAYLDEPATFHVTAATLYVILLFVYLLPIVAATWREFYRDRRILALSFALSWLYWFAPVAPSPSTIRNHMDTVGYFHRSLRLALSRPVVHVVFFLLLFAALPILLSILADCYRRLRAQDFSFPLFLDLTVINFLVVMPWSYLTWEKYFIPLLPTTILLMLLRKFKQRDSTFADSGKAILFPV